MDIELKEMKLELENIADNDYELRDESIKLYCDIGKFLDGKGGRISNLYYRYNEIMMKHSEKSEDNMERGLNAMKLEIDYVADTDDELRDECIKLSRDIGKFLEKNGNIIFNLYDRYNEIKLKYDVKDAEYGRKKYL